MRRLMVVVGTRPNFIKVTRFEKVAAEHGGWDVSLVHTGQHSDERMSTVFFEQFGMVPRHWLGVSGGTPNERMARVMLGLEPLIATGKPDVLMVVGDVDSTLAAAIVGNKCGVRLAHLESGLRSFDRGMPEEHNRVIADHLADIHLVTEPSGLENLLRAGRPREGVHLVGNTMIDALVAFDDRVMADPVLDELGLGTGGHVLMTMHRPATVDDPAGLERLVDLVARVARQRTVVFPAHPRTNNNLERFGLSARLAAIGGLRLCGPLDYFAFQKLIATCAYVITDSGGIQEETTYRRVPCLTLRPNTERPVTVTEGTNELVTFDPQVMADAIARIEEGRFKKGRIPDLWDGHATERVFDALDRLP